MVIAMSKTWFITGASRGFGRTFVEAALDHGDNVVGTARDITALADLRASHPDTLLPVTLDVTDKAAVDRAVQQAVERFGRLDVVVNNAGYGLFGAVEEITGQQLATSWRPTSSARCGSRRPRCRSCAGRAPGTSCRCPRSAAC